MNFKCYDSIPSALTAINCRGLRMRPGHAGRLLQS